MQTPAIALLCAIATLPAYAMDDECHKEWCVRGHAAATLTTSDGIAVGVVFLSGCDDAAFLVSGNDNVSRGALIVDDNVLGEADFETDGSGAHLVMADYAIAALKRGRQAALLTDQGTVMFSLSGSTAAINAAYANCMAALEEAASAVLRPMVPSAKPVTPVAEEWSF